MAVLLTASLEVKQNLLQFWFQIMKILRFVFGLADKNVGTAAEGKWIFFLSTMLPEFPNTGN